MEGIERDSKRQESEVYKTGMEREGGREGERARGGGGGGQEGGREREIEMDEATKSGATKDVPCAGS